MTLLLTILSVFALLALLGVLVLGLFFIIKVLQSVRRRLQMITMGVRAIEHQVAPLGARSSETVVLLDRVTDAFGRSAAQLRAVEGGIGSLASLPRRR
jgi:uncharacterized protein YoxC